MDYCPTDKMWCDILKNPKQGAPYRQDCSHLMNVPVEYYDKVDHKATYPALLDTKHDDKIRVLPSNRNMPKSNPNQVRRSVLVSGLKEVIWYST